MKSAAFFCLGFAVGTALCVHAIGHAVQSGRLIVIDREKLQDQLSSIPANGEIGSELWDAITNGMVDFKA